MKKPRYVLELLLVLLVVVIGMSFLGPQGEGIQTRGVMLSRPGGSEWWVNYREGWSIDRGELRFAWTQGDLDITTSNGVSRAETSSPSSAMTSTRSGFLGVEISRTTFVPPPHGLDAIEVDLSLWVWTVLFAPVVYLVAKRRVVVSRDRRRLRTNACPSCGFDLRVTPTRCPECGWPDGSPSS